MIGPVHDEQVAVIRGDVALIAGLTLHLTASWQRKCGRDGEVTLLQDVGQIDIDRGKGGERNGAGAAYVVVTSLGGRNNWGVQDGSHFDVVDNDGEVDLEPSVHVSGVGCSKRGDDQKGFVLSCSPAL